MPPSSWEQRNSLAFLSFKGNRGWPLKPPEERTQEDLDGLGEECWLMGWEIGAAVLHRLNVLSCG